MRAISVLNARGSRKRSVLERLKILEETGSLISLLSACPLLASASPLTASCPLAIDIAAAIDRQRCNALEILGIGRRLGHAPFLAPLQMPRGRSASPDSTVLHLSTCSFVLRAFAGSRVETRRVSGRLFDLVFYRGWKCFL